MKYLFYLDYITHQKKQIKSNLMPITFVEIFVSPNNKDKQIVKALVENGSSASIIDKKIS